MNDQSIRKMTQKDCAYYEDMLKSLVQCVEPNFNGSNKKTLKRAFQKVFWGNTNLWVEVMEAKIKNISWGGVCLSKCSAESVPGGIIETAIYLKLSRSERDDILKDIAYVIIRPSEDPIEFRRISEG